MLSVIQVYYMIVNMVQEQASSFKGVTDFYCLTIILHPLSVTSQQYSL